MERETVNCMNFIKTKMSLIKKTTIMVVLALVVTLYGCNTAIKVEEIKVDKAEVEVAIGDDVKVNATVLPDNATNKTVTWTSDDPSIAEVTNGLIRGIAEGETTVKASAGDKTVSVKVTVYDPQVTITFNTDGGSEVPSQKLEKGAIITYPNNPTKKGYKFVGWYQENLIDEFDFLTPVEESMTAYAKWEADSFKVIFQVDGVTIDQKIVKYMDKVTKPTPDPTKKNNVFLGWYDGDVAFNFDNGVEGNMTLVAKFDNNIASVIFGVNGEITEELVLIGTKIDKPTDPVQNGYTFLGWYNGENVFDFNTIINEDIYLEAKFERNAGTTFKVEYDLLGGNFTYENKKQVVEDFLKDYNKALNKDDTLEKIAAYGNWSPTDFHTFFYDANYRDKWLWLPAYLGIVGSSTNKKACADVVTAKSASAYTAINANHIYALTYEVRAFLLDIKYTKNANWMSSDYSDYELGNGFWSTFVQYNEKTVYDALSEPYTLITTAYREGYTFAGWYTNPQYFGNPITSVNGNAKVYAKWEPVNPVTEIIIKNTKTTLDKLSTVQLDYTISPSNAFNKKVEFITSDDKILKVSNTGLVTACNAGTATITIRAVANGIEATITFTVNPQDDIEVNFDEEFTGTLYPDEETQLTIIGIGKYQNKAITYKSSDTTILTIDTDGKIKGLKKGEATIDIIIDQTTLLTITIPVIERPSTERVDQLLDLLIKGNRAVVDTLNISLYYDDYSAFQQYYKSTYGSVNYFLFDDLRLDAKTYLINPNVQTNKHSGIKSSTEFITIHDTANIDGGLTNHGSYWLQTSHTTSIHFTVGDKAVIQDLDTRYAAHHAGDGTGTTFTWRDTGVKASGIGKPLIDIDSEGYFTMNGVKTSIVAPKKDGQILDSSYFTNLGPTWKIGENGNYYLGTLWFTTSQVSRGVISSFGGNLNSTGIEMCVNKDGNMYDTWLRTAKLVGKLLIEHKLDTTRVVQHNSFTGKNCPQSLIMTDYWNQFMKMVELEYIIQSQYSDATITMVSNNPDIVDNTGLVIGRPTTTKTISYNITVKIGNVSKTVKLYSVVPGTSSWSQYDGFYSTRK